MEIEKLENKIGFQIGFLMYSGKNQNDVVRDLKAIALEYAEQFKYDYSKNCKCDSRIGETWCCNQCGLPTVKTSDNVIIEKLNKCISEQLQSIYSLQKDNEANKNRIKILQNLNFKYRDKLGISNEPVDALGLISPLEDS